MVNERAPPKFILDACCGGRTFWFDKSHPNTIYQDIRQEEKGFLSERPQFCVVPDKIGDFRKMDFPDKSFKLVIFDPPHMHLRQDISRRVVQRGPGG